MATLPSVSISNDWQERLDKEAQYSNISPEDFVVHAVKMAVETQESVRTQQDDETMVGVQQMLDGKYFSMEEWRQRLDDMIARKHKK